MKEKKCVVCGATDGLVSHHMDAVHGALLPDAVVYVCRKCHGRIHRTHDMRFFKLKEATEKLRRLLDDQT